MNNKVLIKIVGQQQEMGQPDDVLEVVTTGNCYYKNNVYYLVYEENLGEPLGLTHNTVKIEDGGRRVTVIKKGLISSTMVFCKQEKHISFYQTPFGGFAMGIKATKIRSILEDGFFAVDIEYDLEINYEHLSDSHIYIEAKALEEREWTQEDEDLPRELVETDTSLCSSAVEAPSVQEQTGETAWSESGAEAGIK